MKKKKMPTGKNLIITIYVILKNEQKKEVSTIISSSN